MNWKLWTATSLTLASAVAIAAGCAGPAPSSIIINTESGSGGDTSGGVGGDPDPDPTGGDPSGVGGDSTGGTQGKEYYLAIIDADLSVTCGSCHASGQNGAPIFMGKNGEASYNALDQYGGLVVAPENSLLVLHGAHTGPALTTSQKQDVLNWLTVEAGERGLTTGGDPTTSGGGPTTTTLKQALDDYAACMDINDWKSNSLDKLYNAQTLNSGSCGGCHSAGDGGNWLSSNAQETFDMNRKFPYIKRQISGTVDEEGNFKDLVASKRFIQKGAEPCQPNTNCHPAYVLPPNLKTGLDNFVSATIDKWHNKQCGAMMP